MNRVGMHQHHRADEDDSFVTLDRLLDELVISGTVNEVVDKILALREKAGPFGEIVYAGMDLVDPKLGLRSMELMANEVMPRVNQALGLGSAINVDAPASCVTA
jgi:alkanesulfonate monooxygenase SsuD/methylene tetrahydromethanopterin reductase-like flavin-dependent oxidoreductase (luciferase family)